MDHDKRWPDCPPRVIELTTPSAADQSWCWKPPGRWTSQHPEIQNWVGNGNTMIAQHSKVCNDVACAFIVQICASSPPIRGNGCHSKWRHQSSTHIQSVHEGHRLTNHHADDDWRHGHLAERRVKDSDLVTCVNFERVWRVSTGCAFWSMFTPAVRVSLSRKDCFPGMSISNKWTYSRACRVVPGCIRYLRLARAEGWNPDSKSKGEI